MTRREIEARNLRLTFSNPELNLLLYFLNYLSPFASLSNV